MRFRLLFLFVLPLIISANIYAGGFQLNEHGSRALAMGGAFTAIANDPSAIYWNGAGLSYLSGTNILFGASFIAPNSSFRGVAPDITKYKGKNLLFYPVHFFASHKLSDKFSVGLGFTTPFGLGTEWDENWPGKYLAVKTELKTFIVTPVIAYKPIESLSISAGFVYSFADVLITRKNQLPSYLSDYDAFISLEGDDMFAYGFNAGIMFKPTNFLTFGASYHSEVKYEFEGTATILEAPAQALGGIPKGNITAELTTPQNIAGGVAIDVSDRVKLSADFQYVGWSSYDTLAVTFIDSDPNVISASPRMYEDSYIIRFGGSYRFNDQVTFMGGIYYDKNPVSTQYLNPSLPESNRLGFSLGIEAKLFEHFSFQGSYLFIRAEQLSVIDSKEVYNQPDYRFNGTYNTYANIFSLSFLYSL